MSDGPGHATPDTERAAEHLGRRVGEDPALVLVRRLAPLIGLDPTDVRLERTGAGPHAAARPSTIALRDDVVADRALMAHELAHVAQHANRALPGAPRPDVTAAEREAGGLALAARSGAPLWRPAAVLPAGHAARETDATGVTPATAAAPAVSELAVTLAAVVRRTHAAEIKRVTAELNDRATWTWDSVETALQIMEAYDFVTARALARALDGNVRVGLAHLNDEHHKRHPTAAAAALAALDRDDVMRFIAEAQAPARPNEGDAFRVTLKSAVHGVQPDHLEPDALRGLQAALRLVPQETLVGLTRGDRRDDFRELLERPTPTGDERESLQQAVDRETRVDRAAVEQLAKDIVTRLQAILTSNDAGSAGDALDLLATLVEQGDLAPGPTTAAADPSTPAAPATPARSNAPPTPSERLRAVVATMDGAGLIDRLLDGFPSGQRYAGKRSETLRTLLEARAPALTLRRIESLLSYKWNDWAVRDDEARFAYLLVRTLPIAMQDTWRESEGGKWFSRLLDNLPAGMVQRGEYTGVGTEFTIPGVTGDDAANPEQVAQRLREINDYWAINSAPINAQWTFRRLLGLMGETGKPVGSDEDWKAERPLRTAVVRRFDAVQKLRDVYGKLPDEYVFGESTRQEILDLTAMRDPVQIELHAASLLSTGWFSWITSREAWTAYQLIRSLSPERQKRFEADDPARWSSLRDALTPGMKASLAFGAATGRGAWPGREELRKRLNNPRLWDSSGERAGELRALSILARASDDAAFVFELSKVHQAWSTAALRPMVAALSLYDPTATPPRLAYEPEKLEARSSLGEFLGYLDRQVLQSLVGSWRLYVAGGVALLWDDTLSIGGRSVHISDFDLSWAQWALGGDIGGAVLAERARTGPPQPRATPRSGQAGTSGPNRLSGEADLGTGAVRLRMSELALARVNVVRGGSSYRTGPVTLKNLRIQADFSDRHYRKPVGFKLDTEGVDVDDFVGASGGNAWAVGHLSTFPFRAEGGAMGTENLDVEVPREGQTIPIPVFSYLFDALSNIVAIKGGIPFDFTLVDYALIPFTSGMSFLASHAVSIPANALFKTSAPLDSVWGYATDGVLRPPRSVVERAKDAVAMLRSFNVSFKELKIDGLTIGAGTQVSSIVLRDVNIGVGLSRPAYLRQLRDSLKRVRGSMAPGPDQDATDHRIEEAERELGTKEKPGLEALEAELEKLERKDRWEAGSLSAAERARLAQLSDLLRGDAGATVDIESIKVGRVSGAVEAEGGRITGIHLEGRLPLGPSGYLADEDLVARFVAGGRRVPNAAELAATSDVRLTIAKTELFPGRNGAPTLRIVADKVPTAADLTKRLAEMAPAADAALRQRLTTARDLVREIEELRGRKDASDAEVQEQITARTDRVRALLGITVGSLTLGPVTGGLDPASGALVATVHNVDARDISGDGFAVRRVHGDLTLGVGGLGGLDIDARELTTPTGQAKARSALTGRFGADATLEGVRTEIGDVGDVTIAGLAGEVSMLVDGYRVSGVRATRIALGTVNVGVAGARVTARQVTAEGLGLDAEVHLGKDGAVANARISRLDIARITADTLVYDSVDEKTGERVHAEVLSGALVNLRARDLAYAPDADGTKRLSGKGTLGAVEDLRFKVVLNSLDSASKTLKETRIERGTLEGGGAPGAGPVLSADFVQDATGRRVTLGVDGLRLLGAEVRTPDGTVLVRRLTVKGKVDLTPKGTTFDVELGDVDLGRVRWKAGTATISADRAIRLQSVHAVGSRKPNGDLKVDELEIKGIDASDLRYRDPPIDVHLGRFGKTSPQALRVGLVHLSGLEFKGGKRVPGVHVDLTGAHVDFGGTVADGIRASGELDAEAISLDLYRGRAFAVRLRGLGGDVFADMAGLHTHAVLDGLNADTISVTPAAIRVGGLHLGRLTLDALRMESTAPPHPFTLTIADEGALDLLGVDLTARLDRWLPGEKHAPDEPFKKVVVDRLEIAKIQAYGLVLDLPSDNLRITLPDIPWSGTGPMPEVASLHHVVLEGAEKGTGFEYVPGKAGYLQGAARLDSAFIPRLEADVKGRFKGNVELRSDKASIGFVARGATTIDITRPRAKIADPATLAERGQTIQFAELGAESVSVKGGAVTVKGGHLDSLRYEQPGVLVEVPKISMPRDVTAAGTGGTIPELAIDNAHIRIDLDALRGGGGAGTAAARTGPPLLDQATLAKLLDSLQGDIALQVLMRVPNLPLGLDPRDLTIPVELHFTDGRIDYQKLQTSLNVGVTMKVANEVGNNSPILGAVAASSIEFWWVGDRILVFGLHFTDIDLESQPSMPMGTDVDIYVPPPTGAGKVPIRKELVSWTLDTGEIKEAHDQYQVRLFRLINRNKSAGKDDGPDPIDIDTIELRDILANVSVRSKDKIPISLDRPPVVGRIELSPDALVNLHVEGGVAGAVRPAARTGTVAPKGLSAIGLDRLSFDSVVLQIGGPKGTTLTTGTITVTKLKDGRLDFLGQSPSVFEATIEKAVARDITWKL